MTDILHTADTHIGYHQYHKPQRERDFMDAFKQTIDGAIDEDVSAYVHAGDLFENPTPSPAVQQEVIEELNRLSESGIEFLSVVGNHDRATKGQWLDLFEEAGCATHLGTEPTVVDGVAFYGIDYMGEAERNNFTYRFDDVEADAHVLVAHGQFEPLATYADWNLEDVLARANIEFDVVLLGDEHQFINDVVNETPVTYPGSTERTATSQRDQRTYSIVNLSDGVSVARQPIDTRSFTVIEEEMEENDGMTSIKHTLQEYDLSESVVRVRLTGSGKKIVAADLEEFLQNEMGAFYAIVDDQREFEREVKSVDVTFSDPDRAVESEIDEMNLSETFRDIESMIRDEDIAKGNLRDDARDTIDEVVAQTDKTFKTTTSKDDSEQSEYTERTEGSSDTSFIGVEEGEVENENENENDDIPSQSTLKERVTDGSKSEDEEETDDSAVDLTDF